MQRPRRRVDQQPPPLAQHGRVDLRPQQPARRTSTAQRGQRLGTVVGSDQAAGEGPPGILGCFVIVGIGSFLARRVAVGVFEVGVVGQLEGSHFSHRQRLTVPVTEIAEQMRRPGWWVQTHAHDRLPLLPSFRSPEPGPPGSPRPGLPRPGSPLPEPLSPELMPLEPLPPEPLPP